MSRNEDFFEPRLDIIGFLVDYFSWRIELEGEEWYEKPILPSGEQPEYLVMRKAASMFERRYKAELFEMAESLRNHDRLDFMSFVEVVQEFERIEEEQSRGMSYGRLLGLVALGGVLAVQMTKDEGIGELQKLALFFSKYLGARIEKTWAIEGRSWAGFMKDSSELLKRDTALQAHQQTWLRISYAVGATAIGLGALIGTKLLLSR